MLETADVIVIGGGVFGTAAALHLVTEGAGDVMLLERDGIAEGTSAAGAGFIDPWAAGSNAHLGSEELAVEDYGLGFTPSWRTSTPRSPIFAMAACGSRSTSNSGSG